MDENMVDVLIYLSLRDLYGRREPTPSDQDVLEDELTRAGFTAVEIHQALRWLDGLAVDMDIPRYRLPMSDSMRVYNEPECAKLDPEARGWLLSLEQNGILDPVSRELVIDRVLALEHAEVSVDELEWVVLLVLMNRPGREAACTWMEDLIYHDGSPNRLH